jgi:hypothetical protein
MRRPAECPITDSEWRQWGLELDAWHRAQRAPKVAEAADPLVCAGAADCVLAVGMIDRRGYLYCGPHGLTFRGDRPVRTLTRAELARLRAGDTIAWARV